MPTRTARPAFLAILFSLFSAAAAADKAAAPCGAELLKHVPPRSPAAGSVSDFVRASASMDDDGRERLIREELLAGNLPDALRHTVPVQVTGTVVVSHTPQIVVCVLPDYLAIGSDGNSLIAPMRLATALSIARNFGFILPTPTIVDAIYAQAGVKLRPQPLPAGSWMRSTEYYLRHNALIVTQRDAVHAFADVLTAGHKKDLVLTNRLWANPERVAIYGWQRPGGEPIQPLSTVHGARYADYSHGVRLVSEIAYVDGQQHRLLDLLEDTSLAKTLNSEGPLHSASALIDRLTTGVVAPRVAPRVAAAPARPLL